MRLLLWVEYLLKDHLEEVPCLQNQHLRYILFWMCEKNFRDWQEPRLGIKLKAYLKTLYNSLSMESLPHYFIMSSNMMKSIPEKYIRQAQVSLRKGILAYIVRFLFVLFDWCSAYNTCLVWCVFPLFCVFYIFCLIMFFVFLLFLVLFLFIFLILLSVCVWLSCLAFPRLCFLPVFFLNFLFFFACIYFSVLIWLDSLCLYPLSSV